MKILFAGLKHEYGKSSAGLSFEYQNFYETLSHMPDIEASFFATDDGLLEEKRDNLNKSLIETVMENKPDLLFCFLFTEELKKETIKFITQKTSTKTFNWFADDHWRFPIYSKYWAPLFTFVATTDSRAVEKYSKLGIKNVIHSQWGVNPRLFFPKVGPDRYNITFVGLNYSVRQQYVEYLQKLKLPMLAFGSGWPTGRIPKEKTAEIWSNSKINLNFSESYAYGKKFWFKSLGKTVVKKELGKYRFSGHNLVGNLNSIFSMRRRQIKSRTFEIPACGGFLLTGDADNLRDYYVDGKEIVIFKNKKDLAEKCEYYLKNEPLRAAISRAGYERTIKEHTYEERFKNIFRIMR